MDKNEAESVIADTINYANNEIKKNKKKNRKIIVITIAVSSLIIVFLCCCLAAYASFKVGNPFTVAGGYFKVAILGRDYAEISESPRAVIAKADDNIIKNYMEARGFTELKDEQMGEMRVFSNGAVEESIIYKVGSGFSRWLWDKEDEAQIGKREDQETRLAGYKPQYYATDINYRGTEEFKTIILQDGFYRADGTHFTDYHPESLYVKNITPTAIAAQFPDIEIFYVNDSLYFLMKDRTIYEYKKLPTEYHGWIVPWDYDGNGVTDLFSWDSWGSGVYGVCLNLFDLTTMEYKCVVSRVFPFEDFYFDYVDGLIYIGGYKLRYTDGGFHCTGIENDMYSDYIKNQNEDNQKKSE